MKKIWRWIQQIDALPQRLGHQDAEFKPGQPSNLPSFKQSKDYQPSPSLSFDWLKTRSFFTSQETVAPPVKRNRPEAASVSSRRIRPAIALSLSVLTLTAAMGQRYYRQPELQAGTVSPKTLIAPDSALVVDQETTENRRAAARNGAVPVLVPDEEINSRIQNSLESLFQQADILRRQAGKVSFVNSSQLSTAVQTYIREAPSEQWTPVWSIVTAVATEARNPQGNTASLTGLLIQRPDYQALDVQQQRAARDLIRYQQSDSAMDLQALQLVIEAARQDFRRAMVDLGRLAQAERGLPNDPALFRLSDTEWANVQKQIRLVLRQMLLQGIAEGVPSEQLAIAAENYLKGLVSAEAEELARQILTSVLEPNLVKDLERTRAKAEAAAGEVPEVRVSVQDGETIVKQGETIDQAEFVLLDHFNLSQRRLNIWGLIGFGALTGGAVGVFLLVERTVKPGLRGKDHGLIICMLLGVSGLNVVGLAVYSLPAVALLTSSFFGTTLAATLVGLVAVLLPIGARVGIVPLIASTAGAMVCSVVAPRLRSREELALLGGVIGVIQGAVYLALTWMVSPVALTTWYLPLTGAILQGIYGVVSSVAALGLSPYLEHLFDLVTPIRLAELSSPNRPMLQRLASKAPGTFQHTLFVASLAEAAARALRCNVELVRAGTLYHDIGKMHDPMGFIENQMGGPNKHDEIDDPWVSADIIKKHVSEGLVMARRCRLPKAVRAFIPEHQGTMQISYFYHRAQELAKDDETLVVKEDDFRYSGPIPQSPETGIVMLADSCEAALRSLKESSVEEALAMVNRILKARWRDGQLIDSGLTREHMAIIAQVFVQVWQQYNHKRIAYPKSSLTPIASRS